MEQNIGQNLDDQMSLDPRGYGVRRNLYHAVRAYPGLIGFGRRRMLRCLLPKPKAMYNTKLLHSWVFAKLTVRHCSM